MPLSRLRFFTPLLFFVVIGGSAAFIIYVTTSTLPATEIMGGTVTSPSGFIMILLAAAIPILFLEYYIFAIPLAALFLFVNRVFKAASYEMDLMNIGREFDGRHMIRRAAVPALFSVASSAMLRGIVEAFVYSPPPENYIFMNEAALSLMAALLFMPVAVFLFMPTWVLNDTGVVTHLKENRLKIRQCPDTQGVGRWVSGILGGYALIAFPISAFMTHIYDPYFVRGEVLDIGPLLNSILLIVGLPLFVMAFIIPVVVLNERLQIRARQRVAAIAARLGAKAVGREQIEKSAQFSTPGILSGAAGKEIMSSAKIVNVTTRKKQRQSERKAETTKKPRRTKKA